MFVVKVATDLCYPFCRKHFNQMYHKLSLPSYQTLCDNLTYSNESYIRTVQ
jgi:hypothetical protein